MNASELRRKSADELKTELLALLREQFNLRMRRSLKALDNPLRLRQIRREVARIETILAEDVKGIRRLADTKTSILQDTGKKA